ncbi:uncharacterized protein MCYG_05447 [Microsporum canis CBS 113480]|uniref:Uncharacterized protein n=1 Tax=Arthroderma otae (strain ATCC MYA-4605 / CBS 113480) TaxID=554155 RepID=C5FRX5_ARTOC|nr:uncharacterized protein MCYG_05447 [Microsporum canis CBS 113480]EEQ32628.1 predicted protein [Microsporum canis CBS 113480]
MAHISSERRLPLTRVMGLSRRDVKRMYYARHPHSASTVFCELRDPLNERVEYGINHNRSMNSNPGVSRNKSDNDKTTKGKSWLLTMYNTVISQGGLLLRKDGHPACMSEMTSIA